MSSRQLSKSPKKTEKDNSIKRAKEGEKEDQNMMSIYLQRDLDLINFETKVRQIIRDLLDPVHVKGVKDRELIFNLDRIDKKLEERIDLLEMAVYKKEPETGRTKFDELEDRIIEAEIKLRNQREDLQDQIDNFTNNIENYCFKMDQTLVKIENYKTQIDTNTSTIEDIRKHTEEGIVDIRTDLEKHKQNYVKDATRIDHKFSQLNNLVDTLPAKVQKCEVKCKNSEDIAVQIKKDMKEIQQVNIKLDLDKCELELFNKFKESIEQRMLVIENSFDKTYDRTKSLENWIDIYMPLRTQHQITETVKNCLSRKGKYLLGVVDNLMCNELRQRVFTDVGNPALHKRCLQVVEKLQLEANQLTEENQAAVKEVEHKFERWGGVGNEPDKDLQSGIVEVDVEAQMGESDAEMINLIKEQMGAIIDGKIDKSQERMVEKNRKFEDQTHNQLKSIENMINSKAMDSGQFQLALKTEIEEVSIIQRKQNMENLILMKNITSTLKSLKDSHRYFKETDIQTRDIIREIVDYFMFHLKIISNSSNEQSDGDLGSIIGKSTFMTAMNSRSQSSQLVDPEGSKRMLLEKAGEALKRLNISLFRNQQSTNKLKGSNQSRMLHQSLGGQVSPSRNNLGDTDHKKYNQQKHSLYKLNSPSLASFDGTYLATKPTAPVSGNNLSVAKLNTFSRADINNGSNLSRNTKFNNSNAQRSVSQSQNFENKVMNIMSINDQSIRAFNGIFESQQSSIQEEDQSPLGSMRVEDTLNDIDQKLNIRISAQGNHTQIHPQTQKAHGTNQQAFDFSSPHIRKVGGRNYGPGNYAGGESPGMSQKKQPFLQHVQKAAEYIRKEEKAKYQGTGEISPQRLKKNLGLRLSQENPMNSSTMVHPIKSPFSNDMQPMNGTSSTLVGDNGITAKKVLKTNFGQVSMNSTQKITQGNAEEGTNSMKTPVYSQSEQQNVTQQNFGESGQDSNKLPSIVQNK